MNRAKTPTRLLSSASRKPTPSRVQGLSTPKRSDENIKPSTSGGSTSYARTPPSSRPFTRFRTQTSTSAKIQDDAASTASSSSESGRKTPTRTPLGSTTRLNVNRSSAKTPPRKTPSRTPNRSPSKTHTFQSEENGRSIVIEFSDDIFVTPRQPPTPSSVSVTSSSVIRIQDSPMPGKVRSPLNRSLSASSLYLSDNMRSKMKRSRSEAKLSSEDTSSEGQAVLEGETSRLKVGVRIRPLQTREHGNAIAVAGRDISVASDLGAVHIFTFDHCFPSTGPETASQEDVYETLVRPLVDTAFEGYNACLFAYGQTGSGKTYSMMGPNEDSVGVTAESGIIPRFCQELLARSSAIDDTDVGLDDVKPAVTTTVEISYLEVYNEKIRDLLVPGTNQLRVREHQVYGPYVENLSKHVVNSWNEFQLWLDIGNKKRATAATEMNEQSSRSHSLFTVILTQSFTYAGCDSSWNHDLTRRSQINLVDLAGSERISHSSVTSDRLREGVSINRSLLTLGKVISALVEKRGFVPYRESVLTWLLKDSLGGNSRTTMLATVSPCSSHIDETLATLRYASQARSIVNTVRVNEAPQDKLIRELKAEVERLKTIEFERIQTSGIFPVPISDSEETVRLKKELNDVKVVLEVARKNESALTAQVNNLRDRVSSLESDNVTKDVKMKEYSEINKGLAAKVEELKGEKTALKAENLVINGERLKLQDLLDCSQQNVKQKSEGFEKLEKTAMSLQDDYNSLKRKNCFLESSNEKLRRGLEEKAVLIKELEEQMRSTQDQLNASMATFILKEEFCNAQAALESDAKVKQEEVNRLTEELKDSSSRLTMVQKECEEKIASFEDNVASLIKEVEQLRLELNHSREENLSKSKQLESINLRNKELKMKLQDRGKEVAKLRKDVIDVETQLSRANVQDELCRVMKDLQNEKSEKRQLEEKWKNEVEQLNEELQGMRNERALLTACQSEKNRMDLLLNEERTKFSLVQGELEEANRRLAVQDELRQAIEDSGKSLKEKLRDVESEKKELINRLNEMSGEKSVIDYQLRQSLGRNLAVEEKEDEILKLKDQIEEAKIETAGLKEKISSLEHDVNVRKINEESMEANAQAKIQQIADLQKELSSSHEWNKKLMEEKLVLVKVMEKQCTENDSMANQTMVRDNESLRKDLKICQQRLEKKSTKIETLEKKVGSLKKKLDDFFEFVKKVIENKVEYEDEKAFIQKSLAQKEEETYEFIMNMGFPHHFEVIVRKARSLSEELKIPYDIEIIEGTKSVRFKHLVLSAVASVSHYRLNDWVKQIEKNKSWNESIDRCLPWQVDFDHESQPSDDGDVDVVKKHNWETLSDEIPQESDSAAPPSVYSTDTTNPCPIAWRKTIIKRHLQGIVDDAKVLRQYFQGSEGARVYSILSRIISGVERLEEEAKKKRKSFFICDTTDA